MNFKKLFRRFLVAGIAVWFPNKLLAQSYLKSETERPPRTALAYGIGSLQCKGLDPSSGNGDQGPNLRHYIGGYLTALGLSNGTHIDLAGAPILLSDFQLAQSQSGALLATQVRDRTLILCRTRPDLVVVSIVQLAIIEEIEDAKRLAR